MRIPEPLKRRLRSSERAQDLRLMALVTRHRLAHGHGLRRLAVSRYLGSAAEPKLQVGTGTFPLPGWLNSDILTCDVHLDISRRLPLPDDAFSYVYAEHVIEHVSDVAGVRALREFHRVLRPGGVLRLTTPDLKRLIAIYENRNPVVSCADYATFLTDWTGKPHERPCEVLNGAMRRWGHRYIYDEEDLTVKLVAAGFVDVRRFEPGESDRLALRGLERHGPEWLNPAEALCLEAKKIPTALAVEPRDGRASRTRAPLGRRTRARA